MQPVRFIFSIMLFCTLFFSACNDNALYEENKEIPDGVWDMKQPLGFDFTVPDTNTYYNFYFNVRNTDEYKFKNLYVFFHTKFPNGKMGNDTIEFPLQDDLGHWYGKGQGDIHDCRLIFRKGVRFPLAGQYHMDVEQAMRIEKLPGIIDVGIRIEKAE
jgi:gliding motility-associated lipoprotein GldH